MAAARGDRRLRLARAAHADAGADLAQRAARPGGDGRGRRARRLPAIALLDSFHFRPLLPPAPGAAADAPPAYSTRTLSVLDALLAAAARRARRRTRCRSARTSLEGVDAGRRQVEVRDFPRLQFGGAHLADPARDWAADVARRSARAWPAARSPARCSVRRVARAARARDARRLRRVGCAPSGRGRTEVPWRAMLATALGAGAARSAGSPRCGRGTTSFGTDQTGNDVLFQAIKSVRTAVVIGSLATLATLPFAIVFGILAGYFKGWVDDADPVPLHGAVVDPVGAADRRVRADDPGVHRQERRRRSRPALERADVRLFLLAVILGVTGWATLRAPAARRDAEAGGARLRAGGARVRRVSHWRIMRRHILPNVMHVVLIVAVLDFSGLVLYEAVLSYVGVGVDPNRQLRLDDQPRPQRDVARSGRVVEPARRRSRFMVDAGAVAANLVADAVREAFDPRARAFRAPLPAARQRGRALPGDAPRPLHAAPAA